MTFGRPFIGNLRKRTPGRQRVGSIPIIGGSIPVLSELTDGNELKDAVTWGTYISSAGSIVSPTTKEMQVNGGSWTAYDGDTVISSGDEWIIREIVTDGTNTRTFTSWPQKAQ